jgi:hypothetical protein
VAPFRVIALGVVCGLMACGNAPSPSTEGIAAAPDAAGGAPGPSPNRDACMQARIDALAAVWEMAARFASVCGADGDCAIVDASLKCQVGCGSAVLAAQVATFESERNLYADGICPTLPMGCGFAPSCVEVTARCMNGTCRPAFAQAGR